MPSAVFIVYTKDGFVIAADGRRRKGELESAELLNDDELKIFKVENPGRSLAYALVGTIGLGNANDPNDPTPMVYLSSEIESTAKALANKRFVEPSFYVRNLCRPAHDKLLKAKEGGLIKYPVNSPEDGFNEPGTTIARLFIVGYYEGTPVCFVVRFFHREQELGALVPSPIPFKPGQELGSGSDKVWNLLNAPEENVFAKYRPKRPLRRELTTIAQAVKIAKQHILACCDPLARSIDPLICNGIGGHIHIAEITPSGFRWHIPPAHVEPEEPC
jgi:hypothetical protein